MGDGKSGSVHSSSGGGVIGKHPEPDQSEFLVAPSTSSEFNTTRLRPPTIACFRIDDVRFKFDSSFVLPAVKEEMDSFARFRKENPKFVGAPISIFGHADPSYMGNFEPNGPYAQSGDDYNKTLSGRRAIAIYAMLIRDASFWEKLYSQHLGGDIWGQDSIRIMLSTTDPSSSAGSSSSQSSNSAGNVMSAPPTGDSNTSSQESTDPRVPRIAADPGERQQLFLKYMNALCGDISLDKSNDFLAKGAGHNLQGDVQGCSRFNPLLIFSQEKEAGYKIAFQNKDKPTLAQRDAANSLNRRVMILVFKKGTQILPAKWPCPSYKDGPAGCKKRFWSDGDTRRSTHLPGTDRKFDDSHDTFACRFYQRLSEGGPCNDVLQYWVVRVLTEGKGPLSKRKALANEPYVLTGSGSPLPEIRGMTDGLGILRAQVYSPVCTMTLKIAGTTVFLDGGALLSLQDGDPAVKSRLYSLGYGTSDTENWDDDTYTANLKQFQKDQGIQETGTADSDTQAKLRELYGS